MTKSVEYTLKSTIDGAERELIVTDDDIESTQRELKELKDYRSKLVKTIEEHKRALLNLYTKE